VYGDPSARLTDQVIEPKELLMNKDLRLNGEYYIRKQIIPSLERIFQLAGADVRSWYDEMPRIHRADMLLKGSTAGSSKLGSRSGLRPVEGAPAAAASVVPTEATSAMVAAQQHQRVLMKQGGQSPAYHSDGGVTGGLDKDDMRHGAGDSGGSGAATPIGTGPEAGTIESNLSNALSKPPRFTPRRRGGKGFVSMGSRIDSYYQSQLCVLCSKLVDGQKRGRDLCSDCTSERNRVKSIVVMQNRLSKAEKLFRATVDTCSSCCRTVPIGGGGGLGLDDAKHSYGHGGDGMGTQLVACESLECSVFWQRCKAQDSMVATQLLTERVMKELEDL